MEDFDPWASYEYPTEGEKNMDSYVKHLIKVYAERYHSDVDPETITKKERIELAIKHEILGGHPWYGMEVVVGRRIGSDESQFAKLIALYIASDREDWDTKLAFYEGLAQD